MWAWSSEGLGLIGGGGGSVARSMEGDLDSMRRCLAASVDRNLEGDRGPESDVEWRVCNDVASSLSSPDIGSVVVVRVTDGRTGAEAAASLLGVWCWRMAAERLRKRDLLKESSVCVTAVSASLLLVSPPFLSSSTDSADFDGSAANAAAANGASRGWLTSGGSITRGRPSAAIVGRIGGAGISPKDEVDVFNEGPAADTGIT